MTETLADLRGAAMKLGQMISLHGDDILPPEFAAVLGGLRNQADLMPERQVRGVLESELGRGWASGFADFDFDPLAAASIGQVHAATTSDGREVAVKIQYPGVADSIPSDVDNLGVLLRVSKVLPVELEIDPLLEDLKEELAREADYLREADNTERYAQLVADDPGVLVPEVDRDLTTRRVITTQRLHGRPMEDLQSDEHSQGTRDRIGARLMRLAVREIFEFRFMQTDPNFANYLFDAEKERLALIDFGSARGFSRIFTDDYRQFLVAAVESDREQLLDAGSRLGFIGGDETPEAQDAYAEICSLFTEPLRTRGLYEFADSDLSRRARDTGWAAITRHRLKQPPSEILFLHRKLVGSFLLCAHIGAHVDCHQIYRDLIEP
jgi:aarF domain-containing kinase